MFFANGEIELSILTVQRVPWPACHISTNGCPYSSLSLRLAGTVTAYTNGKRLDGAAQSLIYTPAHCAYEADYTEGEMIFIHFFEPAHSQPEMRHFVLSHPESIPPLFWRLLYLWQVKKQGYRIEAAALLLEIMVCIQREENHFDCSKKFETALRLMRENYTDPELNIVRLCQETGISQPHLRRLFHKNFGITPIRYLIELRLDHAQLLLCSQSCSVEKAALASGFSDYRYFSRVTKKLRGCTPSQLRIL